MPVVLAERVMRACVRAAVAAPSIYNTQPWLFHAHPESVDVYADRRRQLRVVDPTGRELHISLGAAVFNLRVALAAYGQHSRVRLLPDPTEPRLVATVTIDGPRHVESHDRRLYDALFQRRTNRSPFADQPPDDGIVAKLAEVAAAEGARLAVLDPDERSALLALVRTAEIRQRRNPSYRAELGRWTTDDENRLDGIPVSAIGPWSVMEIIPVRDFGVGRQVPGRVAAAFEKEPTVAVLATLGDRRLDWLGAGEALERVLLEATASGLAVSFMTQPLEIPPLRRMYDERRPLQVTQMILRLGFAPPSPTSPRRDVGDVMILRRDEVPA